MNMKYKRRRYIVDFGFQGRWVAGFMIVALLGSVFTTVIFSAYATHKLEALRWSVFMSAESTGEVLKPLFVYVILFSLIFVSVLLVIAGALMMRKAGNPLYRMVKDLQRIQEGDFSRDIILRQKDEFNDVAVALNDMLGKMRRRFGEFEKAYEDISEALMELNIAHAKGAPVKKKEEKIMQMTHTLENKILQIE